jgi:hypothetical protein
VLVTSPLDVLDSYASAFRDLINARVWQASEPPHKALRLSSEDDWSFICVAMDVVEDASLAIGNVLRFSLSGPTKYDETGEKYLRLYGLLSATYMQQEAITKLYRLMNCADPKKVEERVHALRIRVLRHQLASHSVDFRDPNGGKNRAYVPIRIGLRDFTCDVTENRGDGSFTVALDDATNEHCVALADILDAVYEKSIGTIFRGQDSKVSEFTAALADLRNIRSGRLMILRSGSGDSSLGVRIRLVAMEKGSDSTEETA